MTSKKSKGKPPPLPIFTLRGHKAPINAIVFLKDDSLLLSGDSEGSLIVWNAESRRIETTSRDAHEKGVLSLEVMSDGRILSQGRGGDVKIWRYTKILECLHVMSTGSCTFCKMHFRDTRVLAPSSDPNMFQCWTLESSEIKKQIYVPKCSFQSGMCLALRLLDKSSVLVGFESGHVARFEIPNKHENSPILLQPSVEAKLLSKPILRMEMDSKGFGVCVGASSEIVFFVLTKDSCSIRQTLNVSGRPGFNDVKLRPDDKIIALGGWDMSVRIFQWRRRRLPKPLAVLKDVFEDTVSGVAFSSDSRYLAACSRDKNISVWSTYPPSSSSS
eukprot:g4872.t1